MKRSSIIHFALVSILAAAAAVLAYQVRSPMRIDVGNGDAFRVSGFYAPEGAGADAIRWSGPRAQVVFDAPGVAAPLLLRIRADALRAQDRVYGATVTVNGHPVGAISKAGWREWAFTITDAGILDPERLVVGLTSPTWTPAQLYPGSQDARALGVAVDAVQIEPQAPEPGTTGNQPAGWTIPSLSRVMLTVLLACALYLAAAVLGASVVARWVAVAGVVLVNAVQIALWRSSLAPALVLSCVVVGAVTALEGPALGGASWLLRGARTWRSSRQWDWARVYGITLNARPEFMLPVAKLTAFGMVAMLLAWYVTLGVQTELRSLAANPLPQALFGDFNIYAHAYTEALAGIDPYAVRTIGIAYLYAPPALFLAAPFLAIPSEAARMAVYTTLNLALLALMLWGIGRRYGYGVREIWWWFPLAFSFAPVLETLHEGQINVIAQFGIFMLFMFEGAAPLLAGAGLTLAIVVKVVPLVLLGYLLAARARRTIAWAMVFLGGAFTAAGLVFGWGILSNYMDMFGGLTQTFVAGDNAQALVSIANNLGWLQANAWQDAQHLLDIYLAGIFMASGVAAWLSRRREPFFIVLSLGMLVAPNVMWYHHYTFILLPLFVWMAWSRFSPPVVLWCFVGLVAVQVDRWYWTHGLLPHLFVHASLLGLVAGQLVAGGFARFDGPRFQRKAALGIE